MTIITGTEYKANQGKYIKRAQEGERVIISSHGGYVELKPVPSDDKDVKEHINSTSFFAAASALNKGRKKGTNIILRSHEDIDKYFESM